MVKSIMHHLHVFFLVFVLTHFICYVSNIFCPIGHQNCFTHCILLCTKDNLLKISISYLIKLINSLRNDPNNTILKKSLKRVIRITILLSMLQELSWIIMIPSAEQKSVMFANCNKTIMRCQYLVIIIIGNICVY